MPASRITFALADLRNEILAMLPSEEMQAAASISIVLDQPVYDIVLRELEYRHHGASMPVDAKYRGPGKAVRFAGMRVVCIPLGNREWGR